LIHFYKRFLSMGRVSEGQVKLNRLL